MTVSSLLLCTFSIICLSDAQPLERLLQLHCKTAPACVFYSPYTNPAPLLCETEGKRKEIHLSKPIHEPGDSTSTATHLCSARSRSDRDSCRSIIAGSSCQSLMYRNGAPSA